MKDHHFQISAGIARDMRSSVEMTGHAAAGLIAFLYEQIADAEWRITRAQAEIDAYKTAIDAITKKSATPPQEQP